MATLVQTAPAAGTSSASLTLTFPAPVTAGNLVAVSAGAFNFAAVETISGITLGGSPDNFALTRRTNTGVSPNPAAEIWADQNCAGGGTSLVISGTGGFAGGAGIIGVAWEFSGIFTSGAVDKTAGSTGTSGAWSSGNTATTTSPTELWVGSWAGFDPGSGFTVSGPAAPWNTITGTNLSLGGFDFGYWCGGYKIVSVTAAAAFAGSQNDTSGSMKWASSVATFKGTGGGGPSNPGAFLPFFS